MKRYVIIAVSVGLGIVSCKKDFTCECEKVVISTNATTTTEHQFESRPSSADKTCKDYEQDGDISDLSSFEPFEMTCTVK